MQNLHYTTFCMKMNVLQDIHICTSVPITYLVQSFAFLSGHFRHFLAYVCFLSIRLVSICLLFVYQSILIVFACLVAVSQFSTYEIRSSKSSCFDRTGNKIHEKISHNFYCVGVISINE